MKERDSLEQRVGDRIYSLRTREHMSQARLADMMDGTAGLICNWETGRKLPSTRSIIKLSEVFGVSTDYLLLGDGDIEGEHERTDQTP